MPAGWQPVLTFHDPSGAHEAFDLGVATRASSPHKIVLQRLTLWKALGSLASLASLASWPQRAVMGCTLLETLAATVALTARSESLLCANLLQNSC